MTSLKESWTGHIGTLHFDGADGDSGLRVVEFGLQHNFGGIGDLGAFGQDFVDAAIADDKTHRSLGHIAQQPGDILHLEKIVVRVFNPVLNNPGDNGHIEIPRQHQ